MSDTHNASPLLFIATPFGCQSFHRFEQNRRRQRTVPVQESPRTFSFARRVVLTIPAMERTFLCSFHVLLTLLRAVAFVDISHRKTLEIFTSQWSNVRFCRVLARCVARFFYFVVVFFFFIVFTFTHSYFVDSLGVNGVINPNALCPRAIRLSLTAPERFDTLLGTSAPVTVTGLHRKAVIAARFIVRVFLRFSILDLLQSLPFFAFFAFCFAVFGAAALLAASFCAAPSANNATIAHCTFVVVLMGFFLFCLAAV